MIQTWAVQLSALLMLFANLVRADVFDLDPSMPGDPSDISSTSRHVLRMHNKLLAFKQTATVYRGREGNDRAFRVDAKFFTLKRRFYIDEYDRNGKAHRLYQVKRKGIFSLGSTYIVQYKNGTQEGIIYRNSDSTRTGSAITYYIYSNRFSPKTPYASCVGMSGRANFVCKDKEGKTIVTVRDRSAKQFNPFLLQRLTIGIDDELLDQGFWLAAVAAMYRDHANHIDELALVSNDLSAQRFSRSLRALQADGTSR